MSLPTLSELKAELRKLADPKRAMVMQRFFKTGPGEYGEGDVFLGISVPAQRAVAKHYYGLPLQDIEKLLQSKIHEERLTASILLVEQYKKADDSTKKIIYDFYLANTKYINNWDIIDGSAEYIVGAYLQDKDRSVLIKLAKSESVWERRIAMLATFAYIKQGESADALKVAMVLLHDDHDLIQKAVGWMLREVGKRDFPAERSTLSKLPDGTHRRFTTARLPASASSRSSSSQKSLNGQVVLEAFLKQHYQTMPRTMLRYAIEKFPEAKRKAYLAGTA